MAFEKAGRRSLRRAMTVAALGLLAGATALQACGNSGPTSPAEGGTLTVAIAADVDTLDPAAEHTVPAQQVLELMAEGLVAFDQKGNVVPRLATSWTSSSDSKTWTFTLRKGVKFQDGEPFDANAVKFNFDRLLNKSTLGAQPGFFTVVSSTEVVDSDHVRFNLKEPFAAFLHALTLGVATFIAPNSVNQAPNTPQHIEQPVGTGPYVFKDHVKGDHVTMTRNPNYWGPKPAYATQVYKASVEDTAREALIKAGQADIMVAPPNNDVAQLSNDSSLHVLKASGPWSTGVIINNKSTQQPLLQKPEVRQALNYAVDKQAIIKTYLFGQGQELDSPFSKALPGYCSVGTWPYDPNKAKSMPAAAGASGMEVTLLTSPAGQQITQIVANYLRAVGLKVTVPNPVDNATALNLTHAAPDKAKYELYIATLASGDMDPSRMMDDFRPEFPPGNTLNFSFYDNPTVGDLIAKGNADSSNNRYQTYCQAEKIIWKDAPWIWLYSATNVLVTNNKVKNVYYLPNNYFVTAWAQPA